MATLSGGAKLAKAMREISAKLNKKRTLRVGFLAGATYPAGSKASIRAGYKKRKTAMKGSAGGMSVPAVAYMMDMGTKNIPPRPFFRNMIAAKKGEWPGGIKAQLKATNYDIDRTLAIFGEAVVGQLKESIINTNSPPLAPSTIVAKGFSKPLIDTSHMLNSADYEVVT